MSCTPPFRSDNPPFIGHIPSPSSATSPLSHQPHPRTSSPTLQVQRALDALIWAGNHTCVLVAHRLSTVVNAHSIVVVAEGRAAEQGTHAELLQLNGVYASLVAHQLQKEREQISSEAVPVGGE